MLATVESRLDSRDFFFLLAHQSSGEVRIVETLTDFGDAVYLEMGLGEKNILMEKAMTFLAENTAVKGSLKI